MVFKRQHQLEMEKVIDSIVYDGAPIKKILVKATPGAGKSALPLITGKLINHGLVDKLLWICPRMALQAQGERNFIDPFFSAMFTHNLSIRSSTNEPDPCRGLDGFITTYQAIAADKAKTVLNEVRRRRFAIILDEFHHLDLNGEWHKALAPIMAAVKYQVLMTGTLGRGDMKKIAFVEYTDSKHRYGERPLLTGDHNTAIIQYERGAALEDRAILPIHFVFSDGRATWEDTNGTRISTESFYNVMPKEKGSALYAALSTEFAEHLLALSLNHYLKYQKKVASAKLLVVTANIAMVWRKR